jgi:hypothetical protein
MGGSGVGGGRLDLARRVPAKTVCNLLNFQAAWCFRITESSLLVLIFRKRPLLVQFDDAFVGAALAAIIQGEA